MQICTANCTENCHVTSPQVLIYANMYAQIVHFFPQKKSFFLFGRKRFNRLFVLPARQHWLFYMAENGHIKKNSPILYAQLRSMTSFYMTLFIWPFLGRGRGTSKSNRILYSECKKRSTCLIFGDGSLFWRGRGRGGGVWYIDYFPAYSVSISTH